MANVSVHALDTGHLVLPESIYIDPSDAKASRYGPSLSFLIQHYSAEDDRTTRILFDLGIRRDLSLYPPILEKYCKENGPTGNSPDVIESLAKGGLSLKDIDYVIFSHVHWDHVGYPKDFAGLSTKFLIGPGAQDVLSGRVKFLGGHSVFEPDLLLPEQTIELPPVEPSWGFQLDPKVKSTPLNLSGWRPLPPFQAALDLFGDSSIYIINAPGHLPGHISLLCRVSGPSSSTTTIQSAPQISSDANANKDTDTSANTDSSSKLKYVLLAGDTCHDLRLFNGTHKIATWQDETTGQQCCIHTDIPTAEKQIKRVKLISDRGIDMIIQVDQNSPDHQRYIAEHGNNGTGKFMVNGDDLIEIQKGWFGDPLAQMPDHNDHDTNSNANVASDTKVPIKTRADVEVIFAHDEMWEKDAKQRGRYWPGRL